MLSTHRRIHQHRSLSGLIFRLADSACVLSALSLAATMTTGIDDRTRVAAMAAAVVVFFFVAEVTCLYRSWRGDATDRELLCVLGTWFWTVLILLMLGVVTRYVGHFPRRILITWLLLAPALALSLRLALRWGVRSLHRQGWNRRRFAIVGVNELGFQLARNIENSPELGLQLVGFFDDRPASRTPEMPNEVGHRVGDIHELVEQTRLGSVDTIYITFPMRAEDRIRGVLGKLSDSTASVYIVPDFFVFELLHSRWTSIGGLPAVSIFENPFYGVDGIVKRVMDVCLASLLLAVAAVPMLIIAVLVKLTSRGPVFFRQKRYGLDGRQILVWKFRSMTVCEDGPRVVQAQKHDARVTKVGAILRKTSLDELPQLFNVVEGSMSLVGPRPHAAAHNEEYRQRIQGYMLRHKVKPGITGLAQVSGWRGETDTLEKMEKRIECDHQYIREWSLWLDIKILFKTVLVVLSRDNAY